MVCDFCFSTEQPILRQDMGEGRSMLLCPSCRENIARGEAMDIYGARRNWHTRARVRITQDYASGSVDPPGVRYFRAGEETVMFQWGNRGHSVTRDAWWDSMDIDGAHIIPADKVEVIAVLEEVAPD